MTGGRCPSKATINEKTVVITGANTGIGKETARELARRGMENLIPLWFGAKRCNYFSLTDTPCLLKKNKKQKKLSTSSGGRIIMGCRDMEKCEAAAKEIRGKTLNPHIYARRLDLASMKSIREFAERIKQGDEPRTVQFKVRE